MKKGFSGLSMRITFSNLLKDIFIILFVFLHASIFGQQYGVRVTATLDTNRIRLGEQVHLGFDVVAPKEMQVLFPFLPDTIQNIEVVERSKIDTLKSNDDNSIRYRQKITITCFDPGLYLMQPFIFFYKSSVTSNVDSVATETLSLRVDTISVDTTKAIKDIKPPLDIPYSFQEALPYLLAAVALVAIIAFIIFKLRKRNGVVGEQKPKAPLKPAHEVALDALYKLREQKLWQQGFYKEYQSNVSDIIRNYIEFRFSVPALELPSDETLDRLIRNLLPAESFEKLKFIFQTADIVKFAKSVPLGTENELSMQYAIDFVMMTKPVTKDDFEISNEEKEVKQG